MTKFLVVVKTDGLKSDPAIRTTDKHIHIDSLLFMTGAHLNHMQNDFPSDRFNDHHS